MRQFNNSPTIELLNAESRVSYFVKNKLSNWEFGVRFSLKLEPKVDRGSSWRNSELKSNRRVQVRLTLNFGTRNFEVTGFDFVPHRDSGFNSSKITCTLKKLDETNKQIAQQNYFCLECNSQKNYFQTTDKINRENEWKLCLCFALMSRVTTDGKSRTDCQTDNLA